MSLWAAGAIGFAVGGTVFYYVGFYRGGVYGVKVMTENLHRELDLMGFR